MKIKIKEDTAILLLTHTLYFLFGIFITIFVFYLLVNNLGELGIWLSLLSSIALIVAGFYYSEPKTALRVITWSILVTLIISCTLYFTGLNAFHKAFEGF